MLQGALTDEPATDVIFTIEVGFKGVGTNLDICSSSEPSLQAGLSALVSSSLN